MAGGRPYESSAHAIVLPDIAIKCPWVEGDAVARTNGGVIAQVGNRKGSDGNVDGVAGDAAATGDSNGIGAGCGHVEGGIGTRIRPEVSCEGAGCQHQSGTNANGGVGTQGNRGSGWRSQVEKGLAGDAGRRTVGLVETRLVGIGDQSIGARSGEYIHPGRSGALGEPDHTTAATATWPVAVADKDIVEGVATVAAIGAHIHGAGIAADVEEDGSTGAAGTSAFVIGDSGHRLTIGYDVVAIAGNIAGNDVYQSSAVAAGGAVLSVVAESSATTATQEGAAVGLGQSEATNPDIGIGITTTPHKSSRTTCSAVATAARTGVATVGAASAVGLLAAGIDLAG